MGNLEPHIFKSQRNGSHYLKPLTSVLIFMLAVTSQVSVRLAQDVSLHESRGTGTAKSTSTIRPWPTHDFFLNVISKSATQNHSKTSHEEDQPHLHESSNLNSGMTSRINNSQSIETVEANISSSTEDPASSRQWQFSIPTPGRSTYEQDSYGYSPVARLRPTAKIEAGIPFRVFHKKRYQYPLNNYASKYGYENGSPSLHQNGNVWPIQWITRPLQIGNTNQMHSQSTSAYHSTPETTHVGTSIPVVISSYAMPLTSGIVISNKSIPLTSSIVISSNTKPMTSGSAIPSNSMAFKSGTTQNIWNSGSIPIGEPINQHKVSTNHWGSSGSKLPLIVYDITTTPIPPTGTTFEDRTSTTVELSEANVDTTITWTPQHLIPTIQLESVLKKPPSTIWYKPTINHYYTNDTNQGNASTEAAIEAMSSSATSSPTTTTPAISTTSDEPNANASQIIFKIWSYVDGEMELHSQKKIPAWVLNGYDFSDGQVLNIDEVPKPLKELVSSALNSSSTITKRHSGPGNDYHWQRLPVIHPDDAAAWKPPIRRPVSLNYVLWSTTTPRPQFGLDYLNSFPIHPSITGHDRQKFQDYLFHLTTPKPPVPVTDAGLDSWLKLQCYLRDQMATQVITTPASYVQGIPGNNNKMPDKDVMSNLAALSIILSHVNKGGSAVSTGNFASSYPQSPKDPIYTNNGITGMSPPHKDPFWAAVYPLYQHLVNKGLAASSIIRRHRPKKPKPGSFSTFSDFGSESEVDVDTTSELNNNYNFYPNYDSVSITESPNQPGEYLYTKTSKDKKGRTKLIKDLQKHKKKKKKKKKKHGSFPLFDPSNLSFNFDFGLNFLDILKRKFYTLVALKLAPMIILTALALLPLFLLIWPKILGWIKLGYLMYEYYKPKRHHHGHGWGPPAHHHPAHHGWKRTHGKELHHHFHGYPAPEIHSLVQASYGDQYRSASSNTFDQIESPSDFVITAAEDSEYYDPDLDTEHNRKVMEILMDNKNATLYKLLESWNLERNSSYLTQSGTGQPLTKRKRKTRKKRHSAWRTRIKASD